MKPFAISLLLSTLIVGGTVVYASQPTYPTWWTDAGNQTNITFNGTVSNYAPVNVGQLKNVASRARVYLDNQLASVGGAGPTIDALVDGFAHNVTTGYEPINLGQLKAVAKPFYDRLTAVGYDTTGNLHTHGYAGTWTSIYPWSSSATSATNHLAVNLGQLKLVFSFDLATGFTLSPTLDVNGDGIPDATEVSEGLSPFTTSPFDSDGDGSADASDQFPLDPGFSSLPTGSASDPLGPQITLWTPAHAIFVH